MHILGADQTYEEICGHLLSLTDMAKLAAETIMLNTFSIDLITQVTKCFFGLLAPSSLAYKFSHINKKV